MKKNMFQRIFKSKEMGIFIPWLLICIVTSIVNPAFLSMTNIVNLLRSISITLIGAIGITLVLISGNLDMSVGSIMGLGSLMVGYFLSVQQLPVPVAILGSLVVVAVASLFNAVIITKFKIPALIVTLGTMYIGRGIINVISKGCPTAVFLNPSRCWGRALSCPFPTRYTSPSPSC